MQSDSGVAFNAGRSHYSTLLRAGVKIHERHDAMLHAKTATIDGVWSCVGSTNLDWRSFLHNDEIDATILGREFARQMEAAFAADLSASEDIDLERVGSEVAGPQGEGVGRPDVGVLALASRRLNPLRASPAASAPVRAPNLPRRVRT